ncbi:PUA-like domain-containing protein [Podospora aff. communis PSN243]|uniref:PUA-like domain-containing protein n=1 Tax=Podospora aff. communis PSN243 TaxID=3040156 RepID=A0AAV9GGE1_9PEZI|nr:PUA-like domain-containing protein [Podospora aff. communis PSN243]
MPPPSQSTIPPSRPDIVAFMTLASSRLGIPLPPPKDIFSFAAGSPPHAVNTSLRRAILGIKTATTSWPVPSPLYWSVGDLSVILDGEGRPGAVMRTLELKECAFGDVDKEFAEAEGEGDYESYKRGHVEFYRRTEGSVGEVFGEGSLVLCERFEVIFPRRGDPEGERWWDDERWNEGEEGIGKEGEGEGDVKGEGNGEEGKDRVNV